MASLAAPENGTAVKENGAAHENGAAIAETRELPVRTISTKSIPPPGQSLTGKQEHCES